VRHTQIYKESSTRWVRVAELRRGATAKEEGQSHDILGTSQFEKGMAMATTPRPSAIQCGLGRKWGNHKEDVVIRWEEKNGQRIKYEEMAWRAPRRQVHHDDKRDRGSCDCGAGLWKRICWVRFGANLGQAMKGAYRADSTQAEKTSRMRLAGIGNARLDHPPE